MLPDSAGPELEDAGRVSLSPLCVERRRRSGLGLGFNFINRVIRVIRSLLGLVCRHTFRERERGRRGRRWVVRASSVIGIRVIRVIRVILKEWRGRFIGIVFFHSGILVIYSSDI